MLIAAGVLLLSRDAKARGRGGQIWSRDRWFRGEPWLHLSTSRPAPAEQDRFCRHRRGVAGAAAGAGPVRSFSGSGVVVGRFGKGGLVGRDHFGIAGLPLGFAGAV